MTTSIERAAIADLLRKRPPLTEDQRSTIRVVLSGVQPPPPREITRQERATEWLAQYLEGCDSPSRTARGQQVARDAEAWGFTGPELIAAKETLGVQGKRGRWWLDSRSARQLPQPASTTRSGGLKGKTTQKGNPTSRPERGTKDHAVTTVRDRASEGQRTSHAGCGHPLTPAARARCRRGRAAA